MNARGQLSAELQTRDWDDSLRTPIDELLLTTRPELITNVVKHAQALTVMIALARETGMARLRVADDGVGWLGLIFMLGSAPVIWGGISTDPARGGRRPDHFSPRGSARNDRRCRGAARRLDLVGPPCCLGRRPHVDMRMARRGWRAIRIGVQIVGREASGADSSSLISCSWCCRWCSSGCSVLQHRAQGVLGGCVQLTGLRQVGIALQVHDRLNRGVVHVAGDGTVVVVQLAQLLLEELDGLRGANRRGRGFGLTGVE